MSSFRQNSTAQLQFVLDAARRAHCRTQADLDQIETLLPCIGDHIDQLAERPDWLFDLPRGDALQLVGVLARIAGMRLCEHALRTYNREITDELTNRGFPLENEP